MDNVLLFTIGTIFATAFIGSMIRYRTRDKCLKSFRGFFVTVELKNGKRIWGELNVYHNALELTYPSPHLDPAGTHYETSYILYQEHYGELVALRRMQDELSPRNRLRRNREVERTHHPGWTRRLGRRVRNLFNLLRDAFSQAVSAFIGQVKKVGSSQFVGTQDARLSAAATQLIQSGASAYEPILEKYIGRKVVLEMQGEGGVTESCGILCDYSQDFLSILNVAVAEEYAFNLADVQQLEVNEHLDFEVRAEPAGGGTTPRLDLQVKLTNRGPEAVEVCHAEGEGFSERFDLVVEPGASGSVALRGVPVLHEGAEAALAAAAPDEPAAGEPLLPQVKMWVRANRYVDLVVPRASGTIRHGAETVGRVSMKFLLNLVTP